LLVLKKKSILKFTVSHLKKASSPFSAIKKGDVIVTLLTPKKENCEGYFKAFQAFKKEKLQLLQSIKKSLCVKAGSF